MTQSRRIILGLALLLEFPILDGIVNPIALIHAGVYFWVACLMIAVMPVTKIINAINPFPKIRRL